MISVVSIFNSAVTFLFGLAYEPLKWLGPLWSMVILSWLAGILIIWVFGKVSNQDAIHRTRDRLSAELIGLRLFKDDLRVFFGIQGQVLVWTAKYLRHSLVPMVILMVPTILILIQLNSHYDVRPLRVGEQALVKVKLRDPATLARGTDISLSSPDNLKIEAGGVRIETLKEICWRVRGVSPGRFDLTVSDGQEKVTKRAAVGGRMEGVSSLRTGGHWLTSLLYPSEAPIPSQSAFESIEILYPALDIFILGKHVNWLVLFLVLSLGFGYACKGFLGVQI
jgi:hypothetical protein